VSEKSFVSMEQHQCPVCLEVFDTGSLLFDMRLRESMDRATVTGHSPCKDCQAKIDDGYIALVGVKGEDNTTAKTLKPEAAKRTGSMLWLRKIAWDKIFDMPLPEAHSYVFMSEEAIEKLTDMEKRSRESST